MRNEKGQFVKGYSPINKIGLMAVCQLCGVKFKTKPARIKNGRGKYHNKKCANLAKIGKYVGEKSPVYKNGKAICIDCGKRTKNYKSLRCYDCSRKFSKGENGHHWKGDDVGYHGVHIWMRKEYGQDSFCEACGTEDAKKYEWANISGEYIRDREDWIRLCTKCHSKFDNKGEKISKTKRLKYANKNPK